MHKLFELLRLRYEANLSQRAIGRCLRLSHTSVGQYIRRFEEAGLSWPLDDVSETALTRLLFPPQELPSGERPLPNWGLVAKDLRRKGVTLRLLWFEYKERYPTGFQYTWFCGRYNAWARTCDLAMRQVHRAGEKLEECNPNGTTPAGPLRIRWKTRPRKRMRGVSWDWSLVW